MKKFIRNNRWLLILLLLSGCQTQNPGYVRSSRVAMLDSIRNEPPGDYYVGRRYYKQDYKFWGYIRNPGQPWSSAKLAMLNEQTKLAPDRQTGQLGSDNGYEYKLFGNFSGQTVYEPSSNGFYPEFILQNYELRSTFPPPIFRSSAALDPARRTLVSPY